MKNLLYISTNDGSDMRINKEIGTLSKHYNIIFMGIGNGATNFAESFCTETHLIDGQRNHPITIAKQVFQFLKILMSKNISTIHVINEQLMVFFWPFLFFKHTVLDIFDSIFLRLKIEPQQYLWLKRLVYLPINKIIVTDNNRKGLMPTFTEKRLSVIPNYPYQYHGSIAKKATAEEDLVLLFFGWLGMNRGGQTVKDLLATDQRLKIIMAGWFSDEETKALLKNSNVDYRGVVTQQEALAIAAREADYILCVYAPIHLNHINASPNKIYDAVQTHTPVIINREVKVAKLVEEIQIGVVIDNYDHQDYPGLIQHLKEKKGTFAFSPALAEQHTWESIEHRLVNLHAS